MGKHNEIKQEVEFDIGRYYLAKKQFVEAATHLKISLEEASYVNSVIDITIVR